LVAVTVRVDEAPAVIEAGLAATLTVGAGALTVFPATVETPQPAIDMARRKAVISAIEEAKQRCK
jgi:hypothetical protein